MKHSNLVSMAIAAAVATGLSVASIDTAQAKSHESMEKCYGVVKAGMNDCGTSQHACAGQAKQDGDSDEWFFLPKGTCHKIVGGMTADDKES